MQSHLHHMQPHLHHMQLHLGHMQPHLGHMQPHLHHMQSHLSQSAEEDTIPMGGGDGDLPYFLQAPNGVSSEHSHQGGHVAAVGRLHLDG